MFDPFNTAELYRGLKGQKYDPMILFMSLTRVEFNISHWAKHIGPLVVKC